MPSSRLGCHPYDSAGEISIASAVSTRLCGGDEFDIRVPCHHLDDACQFLSAIGSGGVGGSLMNAHLGRGAEETRLDYKRRVKEIIAEAAIST